MNNINNAINLLSKHVEIIKVSNIYETEPWGYTKQDTFLNACVLIDTNLEPEELLKVCKDIEKELKRKYRFKWGHAK